MRRLTFTRFSAHGTAEQAEGTVADLLRSLPYLPWICGIAGIRGAPLAENRFCGSVRDTLPTESACARPRLVAEFD